MKIKSKINLKNKLFQLNSGITLIALIITIIILLILAGVALNLTIGDNGIFNRSKEAVFKTRMSSLYEQVTLHSGWQVTETKNTDTSKVNAGAILQEMIEREMIDIALEDLTFEITDILEDISDDEKKYIVVYKGELHYVSNPSTKNNGKQRKWCEEIGIPILKYEQPSGIAIRNGDYERVKDLYLCTPKVNEGFVKERTRYLNMNQSGNMVLGNWLTSEPTEDWYDYKQGKWANVYVENNGTDCYYTWIPRYAYKLIRGDIGNERTDVKFIDVKDNSWIEVNSSGDEIKHEWSELEKSGYLIPEAFKWIDENGNTVELSGYWVSKYTLGELDSYILDYTMISNIDTITVKEIKINTNTPIAKYIYTINGRIEKEVATAENYEFTKLKAGDNIINITALDVNGEIIGSMTKVYSPTIVNEPDLTGFDKNTTFYVTWDKNEVEHSEIPITEPAPSNWYEYGIRRWANIVTRNNGQETYYTWIPRYEYTLDGTSNPQKSIVKFIKGISEETSAGGYLIPEAFSFTDEDGNKKQLTGYWVTKYTLGDEASPRFDTEVTQTSNSIKTKGIIGSAVGAGQKYMYYIDGEYKQTTTSSSQTYEYTGLEPGKQYTINIIIRNAGTEEYLGSITKQIKTISPNIPDLTGFNKDVTYYVTYDANGNQNIGEKIQLDEQGNITNKPNDWYDYRNNKWANIVVKTNNATTYYTWIPRYEYKVLSGQMKNTGNQRTEVRFIEGISTKTSGQGYSIPEAFSFTDETGAKKQLTGYWVSKYTLGEQTE